MACEGPRLKGALPSEAALQHGAEGTLGNERAIHFGSERNSFRVWPSKPPIEFFATTQEAGGPALEHEPPKVLIPLACWAPTSLPADRCSAAPPTRLAWRCAERRPPTLSDKAIGVCARRSPGTYDFTGGGCGGCLSEVPSHDEFRTMASSGETRH